MTTPVELKRRHDEAVLQGVAAQARGRFGLALDFFEESLRAAEELGERRKIHAARLNVSSCFLSLGDWPSARAGLAAIILESDDARFISGAAVQLAEALMKEGLLEKSAHYLRLGLEQSRLAGDGGRVVSALTMQGHVAVMEGRHQEAVSLYGEAVERRRELGSAHALDEGVLLDKLGYAQVLAGQVATGLWTLKRSLRMAEAHDNTWGRAEAHVDLAFGFLLGERNARAEKHALLALALAMSHGYAPIRKSGTYVLMEVALRTGKHGEFDKWFGRLQELMPDVKLSRDFFKIFDISDVINLKEF
jgi:tetratricopeptide (TPR) repeat protein